MNNRLLTLAFTGLVAGAMLSAPAMAQDVPGHPRVNEIDQRLDHQENRIDNGVKDGQISPGQTIRDEKRDEKVQQQLSRDEAKHGGHITKREQRRMNHELNKNSHDIHHQRHHGWKRHAHPDAK
jgi:hypothetical protein